MLINSLKQFLNSTMLIAEKNIRIYYKKVPVFIFGLIFPIFMFLSFFIGRGLDIQTFFPGFLAMFVFFLSSSVGPLITPWEKIQKTYERLLSFPVNINTIILGDITAGMLFGILFNFIIATAAILFLNFKANIITLVLGIITGSFCFASLGVLLASPSVPNPSHIMMFSSLVRFPLIFISGIFIPLKHLSGIMKILSYFSPITYLADIMGNINSYSSS